MPRQAPCDHQRLVDILRDRVLNGPGDTKLGLRQAVAARAAGEGAVNEPYDDLVKQIGDAAFRVTDTQVASLVRQLGERAAFEVIVAAALGAGLRRWRKGVTSLEQAGHAPA